MSGREGMLEEGDSPRVLFGGMAAPVRLFSSPSPICSSPSRGDEKETRFGLSVCGWGRGKEAGGAWGQAVWGRQGTCAWGGSLPLSLHVPPTQAECACHGADGGQGKSPLSLYVMFLLPRQMSLTVSRRRLPVPSHWHLLWPFLMYPLPGDMD